MDKSLTILSANYDYIVLQYQDRDVGILDIFLQLYLKTHHLALLPIHILDIQIHILQVPSYYNR